MYSYELSDTAEEKLVQFPLEVALAVADVIAQVCADPWNYGRVPDEPLDRSKAHRCVPFDGGFVWCLIVDRDALVWVTEIQWIG